MKQPMNPDDPLRRGLEVFSQIRGEADLPGRIDPDLGRLVLRYAFGDVWGRPGLDLETRRLLALSMTLAGGHMTEFKLHLKMAVVNGMDRSVIKELMLQSAVYCGVPSAVEAFRAADEVYEALDRGASG